MPVSDVILYVLKLRICLAVFLQIEYRIITETVGTVSDFRGYFPEHLSFKEGSPTLFNETHDTGIEGTSVFDVLHHVHYQLISLFIIEIFHES